MRSTVCRPQPKANTSCFPHLAVANGSLGELATQLEIPSQLGYLDLESASLIEKAHEVGGMLAGLRRSLGRRLPGPES
jgi:four helix bundle protein